jgi:hypothetical protein
MSSTENFQLIVDFADGSLNPAQEDKLFLQLSSDETMKEQFKSHMAIKTAVQSSSGRVTLPSASKGEVFGKLGLVIPATNIIPDNVGLFGSMNRFMLQNRRYFATALVSIALTASFFMFMLPKGEVTENSNANFSAQKPADPIQNVPSISANEVTETPKSNFSNVIHKTKAIVETPEEIPAQVMPVLTEQKAPTLADASIITNLNPELKLSDINEFTTISAPQYSPSLEGININTGGNFAFELRGANYWNAQSPTIGPKVLSNFNNTGLTAFYKLNTNFYAGLDIRQETFFLTYSGQENGEYFDYQQQPNFTTASAIFRYKAENIGLGISPFAQISAGLNKAGFLGRAMTGIQYKIIPSFSVMMGIEYNTILYKHQNNYFNNSKIGLNYGLMYMF